MSVDKYAHKAPPKEPTIRLFTALAIPDSLTTTLQRLPENGLDDARRTTADDLHITLRFLGDVPEDQVPAIEEALARVRRPPFHVSVKGMGVFENPRQAVLYANIESTRKLTALAAEINEALAPLGFEMPNKPYVPHITLFRLKSARGAFNYIKSHERKLDAHWEARRFDLMKSSSPDEANIRYNALASYDLRD